MNAENIVGLVIYAFVSLFMMAIGIAQLKSQDPVGFYSGEKPPKAEDLTDVHAWNKNQFFLCLQKHILRFQLYGHFNQKTK